MVIVMNKKDMDYREMVYQITMDIMKKLLKEKLISKEEYLEMEEKMIEKYTPVIGKVYSDIDLI